MTFIVPVISFFFFGVGLWQHDWRVIVGSIMLLVVGMLIADEARNAAECRRERRRLDRLWGEDAWEGHVYLGFDPISGQGTEAKPLTPSNPNRSAS